MFSESAASSSRPRGPYVHRLHTPKGCRLELARLYKLARKGEIESLEAWRLAQILLAVYKVLEGSDLVRRIDELEHLAMEQGRGT